MYLHLVKGVLLMLDTVDQENVIAVTIVVHVCMDACECVCGGVRVSI